MIKSFKYKQLSHKEFQKARVAVIKSMSSKTKPYDRLNKPSEIFMNKYFR